MQAALYQAIVDIYLYFLEFDPNDPEKARRGRTVSAAPESPDAEK